MCSSESGRDSDQKDQDMQHLPYVMKEVTSKKRELKSNRSYTKRKPEKACTRDSCNQATDSIQVAVSV